MTVCMMATAFLDDLGPSGKRASYAARSALPKPILAMRARS